MIRSKNHFYERKIGHKKVDNALETCIFPACDFIWGQFCSLNSCWGFCPSLQIRLCFLKGYPLLEYPVKNKKSSDNALLLTVCFADCCVGTLLSAVLFGCIFSMVKVLVIIAFIRFDFQDHLYWKKRAVDQAAFNTESFFCSWRFYKDYFAGLTRRTSLLKQGVRLVALVYWIFQILTTISDLGKEL